MEATQNQPDVELIPIAREALADSPVYVEHICGMFSACGHSLRAGEDREGMLAFARGAADLAEFVQLFQHLARIAHASQSEVADAFTVDIAQCVAAMETALNDQDLVTVSDEIEARLLPILRRWDTVAQELQFGLN